MLDATAVQPFIDQYLSLFVWVPAKALRSCSPLDPSPEVENIKKEPSSHPFVFLSLLLLPQTLYISGLYSAYPARSFAYSYYSSILESTIGLVILTPMSS
ncbi:hypothetical protein BJX99DRAFT_65094 [Aspergillus californicus]